jgi:diamine N-acetyltransferase
MRAGMGAGDAGGDADRAAAAVPVVPRPIARDTWRAALALRVTPAQLRFVADSQPIAAIALAKAFIRPDGFPWHPYGLHAGEALVGFVAVSHDEAGAACWLHHFFIGEAWQGRGHGGAGLRALLALLAAPPFAARTALLTVHPANVVARHLYARAGFAPTGAERDGEPIWRLALG